MSMDAIKSISEAETEARQAKTRAQQAAEQIVADAEKAGKESLTSMNARAESEIATLIRKADLEAEEHAKELASTTANRQATLRARAESRLDKAAQLIIERIVNV